MNNNFHIKYKLQNTKYKGFTLMELLLYSGILIVSAGLIGGIFYTVSKANLKIQAENEVNNQMSRLEEIFRQKIEAAKGVNTISGSLLELNMGNSTSTFSLGTTDNTLYLQEAGGSQMNLNVPDKVKVTSLLFTPTGASAIKIDITLQYNSTKPELAISHSNIFVFNMLSPFQYYYYCDYDGDSYYTTTTYLYCAGSSRTSPAGDDCDDSNSSIHPGATETCNGKDDNCNGQIDEGVKLTFYQDADNDTYGNGSETVLACSAPQGYVTDNTDCNDTCATCYPGSTAYTTSPDGLDQDCDGTVDNAVVGDCLTCSPISGSVWYTYGYNNSGCNFIPNGIYYLINTHCEGYAVPPATAACSCAGTSCTYTGYGTCRITWTDGLPMRSNSYVGCLGYAWYSEGTVEYNSCEGYIRCPQVTGCTVTSSEATRYY
jgi:hypothetical protein